MLGKKEFEQCVRPPEGGALQRLDRLHKIDPPTFGCKIEQSKRAGYTQTP